MLLRSLAWAWNNVNSSKITEIGNGFINGSSGVNKNGTVFTRPAGDSIIPTDNFNPGKYILTVGVWSNKTDERLVGSIKTQFSIHRTTMCEQLRRRQPGQWWRGGGGGGGGGGGSPEIIPI